MAKTLRDIGEFGLIDRIHRLIQDKGVTSPAEAVGIGDDCAVFSARSGYDTLMTCDCMVEGRHYLPRYISGFDLGRRAMVLNISDIGAMGGRPRYAVISLGLRADTRIEDVDDMYNGFVAELNPFQAAVMGGNISQCQSGMFIDITLIGDIPAGLAVRRSTARPGDTIMVTGYPGESRAGLDLLLKKDPDKDLKGDPLIAAYTRPCHRANEGHAAACSGLATAMIDTSDGLLGDLGHICTKSGTGAILYAEKLPIRAPLATFAAAMHMAPHEAVLKESDDYELLITVPPQQVDRLCSVITGLDGVPVHPIGRMTQAVGKITLHTAGGNHMDLTGSGWDHFRT